MLKRLLLVSLIVLAFASGSASAQQGFKWCGYALMEGLPLLDNQLAVLESITPASGVQSQPDELFQHRFNLTHTAVIVEGCFRAYPTRDLILSLLTQAVPYDPKGMADEISKMDFDAGPVTETQVVAAYLDDHLTYTVFDGTADQSAAQARDYLARHSADWETPCDDPAVC